MIPRLHKRGSSFKGACAYILHDPGKTTANRVDWVMTQQLGRTPPDAAWAVMRDTWAERKRLKLEAGVALTGRDNTTPVLHFTLSWHADDKPSPEHMQKAALDSLKVLGLAGHQAVIAAHNDKGHLHVHVVVNTVHPETGKTAKLTYSKERFSTWAEAYEREHGIYCQERIANNERRRQAREARKLHPGDILMAQDRIEVPEQKPRTPYVPVKHKPTPRKQWFEKQEIVARMKAMRESLDAEFKAERSATWARQAKERAALDTQTQAALDAGRKHIADAFRPKWRDLYRAQKKEAKHVERIAGSVFDRAIYVFQNRDRLGGGKPLTLRQMLPLIQSPKALQARVASMHERERRELAREAKSETRAMTDREMQRHRLAFASLRDRQAGERQSERDAQTIKRQGVSFAMAKAAMIKETEPIPEPRPFKRHEPEGPLQERFQEAVAPPSAEPAATTRDVKQVANENTPTLSRAEQIKRDMAEWHKRNQGRDYGREM